MYAKWILAGVAACVFAFVPAAGAAPAKHKPPHAAAASTEDTSGTVPILPLGAPLMSSSAPSHVTPFVTPATRPCVTLAQSQWTVMGGAKLCGLVSRLNNAVAAYPGIKYAQSVRWTGPTPNPLASHNLTGFGLPCYQSPPKSNPKMAMSEDCLFLNVWVPPASSGPGPYPVMVFIHGGAFLDGMGSAPVYDGTRFAGNKVILVTLNYRLGALGFLVGNRYGVNPTGNYGIMDQQMALHWVHDNIAAFGGDTSRITIFGESAGAMSVGLHLFSIPTSTHYFSAAIMESNPVGLLYYPANSPGPSAIGYQFLGALCVEVKGLLACGKKSKFNPMTAPAAKVISAQGTGLLINGEIPDVEKGYLGLRGLPFQPVIDNTSLIMGQPYQGYVAGTLPKPVVFGTNQDEGAVFAALVAAGTAILASPSNRPTDKTYDMVVNGGFPQASGQPTTAQILAAANTRYNTTGTNPPDYQPNAPYYNQNGQAASNIVLDYDFAIANIVTANDALATGGGAATTPMYAYHFNQAPLWDIYGHWVAKTLLKKAHFAEPDNGACDPAIGNFVCHAAELPYVFDTLTDVVPPELGITVPAANLTLAADMNAAWAAFAANPTNPGSVWTHPYANSNSQNTTGAPAVIFNTTMPTAPGAIDPNGVYSIWAPTLPSSGAPASPH